MLTMIDGPGLTDKGMYEVNWFFFISSEEYKLIQLIPEEFRVVFRFLTYIYIWANPAVATAQPGAMVTVRTAFYPHKGSSIMN